MQTTYTPPEILSDEYCTPYYLATFLNYLPIDLDPCANEYSHIRAKLAYKPPIDGLAMNWRGSYLTYINPPYSAPYSWIEKAAFEPERAIALIRLDPTTKWWRAFVWPLATSICFLHHRVAFEYQGKPQTGAQFSCAIVGWRINLAKYEFSRLGTLIQWEKS